MGRLPYYIDGSNHTVGETGGADTFVYKSDSGVDTTADFGSAHFVDATPTFPEPVLGHGWWQL